jgi:hypothetical protein
VPVFFVSRLNQASIHGLFGPGGPVDFELREEPGGAVLATVALPSSDPSGFFENDTNDQVPVRPGNQVVGDFSTDGRMNVPAMITSINPTTDVVQATCFANRPYLFEVSTGTGNGEVAGVAGPGGAIVRDLGDDGLDLDSVTVVELRCRTVRGDSITHEVGPD